MLISLQSGFAEPEVCQPNVPFGIDKNVFGLDVTINDTLLVEVLKRQDEFSTIKFSAILVKASVLLEMVEQLTSVDELHDEVEMELVLERELELHNERMVKLLQDVTLDSDTVKLVSLEHKFFFDAFHRVVRSKNVVLDQVHFSERPTANHLNDLEVCLLHRRLGCRSFVACFGSIATAITLHAFSALALNGGIS